MYVNEVMQDEPFYKNLVIDRFENALKLSGEKILIAAFESDYLFYGIKIKEHLEKNNDVLAVSLDSAVYDENTFNNLACGKDKIICVGKIEIINLFRYFLPKKHIYYVPTDLVFYSAFSKESYIVRNGLVSKKQATLPTVIVDIDIFPKLKLRNIADAFCSVAVSAFWKVDYNLYCIINRLKQSKKGLAALEEAQQVLNKINSENCYEVLLTCQIWLALAVYEEPSFDALTDLYVGFIFQRLSDSTLEECRFFAVEYLLKLYKATLQTDVGDNLIYPDYLTNILRLTELFNAEKSAYLERYNASDEGFLTAAFKKIKESNVKAEITKLLKALPSYKNAYKNLYKAKKSRAKFAIEDSLKALSLAGVTSNGYLKILFDSGVLQQIEKI